MADVATLSSVPTKEPLEGNSALVYDALSLLTRARDGRTQVEQEWKIIQDELALCYSVADNSGVRKIESKLLHLALQKTISKIKMLDWAANATGADQDIEKIVTQGLINIAEKGGLVEALKIAMNTMALYGDAFIHIYVDKDAKYPICFKCTDLDRVYGDPAAIAIRNKGGLRTADEIAIVYDSSLDVFEEEFSEFPRSKEVAIGNIPGIDENGSLTETNTQDSVVKSNGLQYCYYYRKSKKAFGIIAGGKATPLFDTSEAIDGETNTSDYPFMKDGKADFPIIHLKGWRKARGLYHYALGHLLVGESRRERRMQNWADWNMERNVKGMMMVDIPMGKAGEFWQKIRQAEVSLSQGRNGIVTMERGMGDNSQLQINKFASDAVSQEWERSNARHDQNIKRIGIPLDETDRAASESATQTLAEETRADQFAQEFMRNNADEFKFLWETVIALAKEFIDDNDDTVLELTTDVTDVELEDGSFFQAKPTMGWLKSELTFENYFVAVKELSGMIKSPVRELSEIQTLLPMAQTPLLATELVKDAYRALGRDVPRESSKAMFPEGLPEGGMKAVPSEGLINPDEAKKFVPNPA